MANAGIIPLMVAHDYLAEFWQKVFTNLTVHEAVAVRTGATIAVPFRKNSPKLAAELNAFVARNGLGTAFGNVIEKRYLVNTTFAKSATSEAERKKLLELVEFFRKYSDQYRMDYLLMAAQGYQESRLDPNAKSQVGAIGVMQVMPATGKELAVGDIRVTENNIHAGVKYMRFMIDRYYKDEPMDHAEQGPLRLRLLQRRPGPDPPAAPGGGQARARPQRLVRQRRADRLRAHRPRDRHLRLQHLQVLRRLHAAHGEPRAPGSVEAGGPGPAEIGRRPSGLRGRPSNPRTGSHLPLATGSGTCGEKQFASTIPTR